MSNESSTKERPILFNGEMVRVILDGRKTQTRRVLKGMPSNMPIRCPYGKPGDRLWVRERIFIDDAGDSGFAQSPYAWHVNYPADGHSEWRFSSTDLKKIGAKPSIHMPRWASRILLEITDVRVERLQDISEEDAKDEGVKPYLPAGHENYRVGFMTLWDEINATRGFSWDSNPLVWVVSFRRIK